MNKIKFFLIAIAILGAVCSAFSTKRQYECYNSPQYIPIPDGSHPYTRIDNGTDNWGTLWDCQIQAGYICTYYQPDPVGNPNWYAPCHLGTFYWIYE